MPTGPGESSRPNGRSGSLPDSDSSTSSSHVARWRNWPSSAIRLARNGIDALIAADESIRRAQDPYRVAELEAADVAVLKVQPLGGVRACLEIAERIGLPVVVSSALETSIGIRAGVALAAALPQLPFACGLNTVALLADDLVTEPLVAVDGVLEVRDPVVDVEALRRNRAGADDQAFWQSRLMRTRRLADG